MLSVFIKCTSTRVCLIPISPLLYASLGYICHLSGSQYRAMSDRDSTDSGSDYVPEHEDSDDSDISSESDCDYDSEEDFLDDV